MPAQRTVVAPLQDERARGAIHTFGDARALLVLLVVACCVALALAAARHTGSLAFPIDDAYIYSNYALALAQGQPFSYNPGETSGGITGLGWYLLCTLFYGLLAPFHGLLGGLAPPAVRAVDPELARQAGHLYLAAYLPGLLCLAATALGAYRLARLTLPGDPRGARDVYCLLIGAVAAADLGLVWGAMSGLEVALASALAVWAITLLLEDTRRGRLRWSLLLAALLPWARPDLLAVSLAALLWLVLRAIRIQNSEFRIQNSKVHSSKTEGPQYNTWWLAILDVLLYGGAILAGLGVLAAVYFAGWGRPLPSSFYAKVGGLRFGARFFSAAEELWIAGRYLPFVVAALTLASGLALFLWPNRDTVSGGRGHETGRAPEGAAAHGEQPGTGDSERWAALLLLMVSASYVAALMLTLPWFGQEDRYLLPVHPFVIVLLGGLAWRLRQAQVNRQKTENRKQKAEGHNPKSLIQDPRSLMVLALVAAVLVAGNYLWATREYVVQVRNIADAHVQPALWLAANTPPASLVASEPIGAVRLFSGRRTVDLVGLTTPATLGTYRDWPATWTALRDLGADYLLYYPDWFDEGVPPWAVEVARFPIPDNRIAGDDVIAVYRLDWSRFRE